MLPQPLLSLVPFLALPCPILPRAHTSCCLLGLGSVTFPFSRLSALPELAILQLLQVVSELENMCSSSASQCTTLQDKVILTACSGTQTSNAGSVAAVERRLTITEGLYSGLSRTNGPVPGTTPLDNKIRLLVEAPAAVEDALASLLDNKDAQLQACT